jgi:sugar phosphate isomerase/epimerase
MKHVYCIPKWEQISRFQSFSEEYDAGFEYNEFFLPDMLEDRGKLNDRINGYLSLSRDTSQDTMHGVFLDICIHSDDPKIYQASNYRIHQSMEIACRLGVSAVIFHTNTIANFRLQSYRRNWVVRNEAYWRRLLEEYPQMIIYLENMFDDSPDLLAELALIMKDEPRFQVCLDVAHAFISPTPLSTWFEHLGPYVSHLHINDNDKKEDTHLPVGSRLLPWDEYRSYLAGIPEEKRPSVLIEVRNFDDLTASVAYMQSHDMYPFA